ncbi:MAG: DUF58 domain-containing protein [Deltaproteobacteria bacterium]|nr:DUF58 domain-containing protein [Deltaproteobacteria bacterium]
MNDDALAAPAAAGAAELLPAAVVHGIAPLELRARVVADGVLAGGHRSRRFGSSSEFAEHKLYAPGDDLRRLDWRAFARLDRYFVRRHLDETTIEVALVVDTSASMAYAGGARGRYSVSKLEVAKTYAAALAWLAVHHGDAVGVSLFAGGEREQLAPRARRDQLAPLLELLARTEASGTTALEEALEAVAERLTRRALVVVISDLFDCGADEGFSALEPLGVLRRMGCDALVLHTLDRDELELPFDGVVRFEDLEGDRVVQVEAPLVRDSYLEELRAFLDGARDAAERRDVRWQLAPTDAPPVRVLAEALTGAALLRGGT